MKITHNKVGQNLNLTDTTKAGKSSKSERASKSDLGRTIENLGKTSDDSRVNLSDRAMDIKKAKEIAMSAPDVREDKVKELQKMIDAGKYNVDAKDIADKMVDEELQWT